MHINESSIFKGWGGEGTMIRPLCRKQGIYAINRKPLQSFILGFVCRGSIQLFLNSDSQRPVKENKRRTIKTGFHTLLFLFSNHVLNIF